MILSGKKVAEELNHKLKEKIQLLEKKPKLVAVLVWNNTESLRYISQKRKTSESVGMVFELLQLDLNISEDTLLSVIQTLNHNPSVSWYIVQLPLPQWFDAQKILSALDPKKDVDWFHPLNQGKVLIWDMSGHIPCTPKGIMKLLTYYDINIKGKHIVIIGRSNIVWKPLAALCINAWATVTSCNSLTSDLRVFTQNADIVISAVWKAHFLEASHFSPQATIIDVWFSIKDEKLFWDIDTESCLMQWNKITPVPGGIGPMTVAMLLENTYLAYIRRLWIQEK